MLYPALLAMTSAELNLQPALGPDAWSGQKTTHIRPCGMVTRSVHLRFACAWRLGSCQQNQPNPDEPPARAIVDTQLEAAVDARRHLRDPPRNTNLCISLGASATDNTLLSHRRCLGALPGLWPQRELGKHAETLGTLGAPQSATAPPHSSPGKGTLQKNIAQGAEKTRTHFSRALRSCLDPHGSVKLSGPWPPSPWRNRWPSKAPSAKKRPE